MTVNIQLRPKTAPINNSHTLDAALANVPAAAQELHARALVAARANDHKKAIELLTKALALYSDFAVAWNELGVQNMELGRYERSDRSTSLSLETRPRCS